MRIAIIGGTGFGEGFGAAEVLNFETQCGVARISVYAADNGVELIFLPRHGPGHKIPPHKINHRANVLTLIETGVSAVFATAAVGSLQTNIAPGDFVILDDFIDLTKGEVVTFYERAGSVQHTSFETPFDPTLRGALIKAAKPDAGHAIHEKGTYLCLSGPRYETPAEVKLFSSWGASVVGMTVAPEAILCREAGIPYATVATVTNFGCGLVSTEVLSHADVEQMMAARREALQLWLLRAIQVINK